MKMCNTNGVRDCRNILKLITKDRFPKLKDFALKMHSKFLVWKHKLVWKFSMMRQVKSKNGHQMAYDTLDGGFRHATTNTGIDKW